jgi:hypothetical protein
MNDREKLLQIEDNERTRREDAAGINLRGAVMVVLVKKSMHSTVVKDYAYWISLIVLNNFGDSIGVWA